MALPVVIAENGRGIPVIESSRGLPVFVAANGIGLPVVIAENGRGLPVMGLTPAAPTIAAANIVPTGGAVGAIFTAVAVGVTGVPSPARAYQWYLDAAPIGGATSSTYQADTPGTLSVRITATNSEGSAYADSAGVEVVAASENEALWGDEPAEWGAEPALWGA